MQGEPIYFRYKMNIKRIVYIAGLIILTGCNSQKNNDIDARLKVSDLRDTISFAMNAENAVTITVPPPTEGMKVSDIFEDFKYIPLESSENSLMGQYQNASIYEDRIFIHDVETNMIYIFDMQGKFIHKVGKRGNGPGEFFQPESMTIDPFRKQLLVYDTFIKKIFYFTLDGEFLRTEQMAIRSYQNFKVINPNLIAFGVNRTCENPQLEEINNYNIIYTDSALNVRGGVYKEGENYIPHFSLPSFSTNGKQVYYTPPYTSDVYKFAGDTLVHQFHLDYSKWENHFDLDKLKALKANHKGGYYYNSIHVSPPVLSSNRFLLFKTITEEANDDFYSYYDKVTREILSFNIYTMKAENDLLFTTVLGSYGDYFIGYASASSLSYLKENREKAGVKMKPEISNMIDSLYTDDNDVLVLFKMKPIQKIPQ